ncbi:uncharacterized protein B0I36DRAFT_87880 [Microdochium trichocladiopsis]|uniref:Uncharacterized protein n=1 Tax=Microdochium trichocladiopsis TaxID=1682393 RepID=A0A9P8YBZ3_9PEZI|nr:uncharacterized protein B0I36DRAFT_87880 [Microdochium trichocladiopsis]KAH7035090.1 hypothetical protein B0I36DRAFT_87880 [Microdochium trichocladiopsis]
MSVPGPAAPPPGGGSTSSMPSPTTPASTSNQHQGGGRHDESWIEVSSHPSSSSVSSIGDEIVTTGLQVRNSYAARRKRLHPRYYTHLTSPQQQRQQQLLQEQEQQQQQQPRTIGNSGIRGNSSSQDEYDESDSEEDRVLTSSSENITNTSRPLTQGIVAQSGDAISSSDDDDDDDHATTLGSRPSEPFRPQPNAFSHPPSHLTHRHSTSAIPPHHPRPSFSQRSQTRADQGASNFMSPSHQEDNDAALRASLTTLLSVAAAARGRTKDNEKQFGDRANPATGNQPVELRLIPESELLATPHNATPVSQESQQVHRPSPQPSTASRSSGEKVKRSTTPSGKSPRATKKKKTMASTDEAYISPTMMTWVVGASVIVLVSVVGFGAGYVIGREVGRQETLSSLSAGNASAMAEGGSCSREVLRNSGGSLKRLRWGATVGRSVAV